MLKNLINVFELRISREVTPNVPRVTGRKSLRRACEKLLPGNRVWFSTQIVSN